MSQETSTEADNAKTGWASLPTFKKALAIAVLAGVASTPAWLRPAFRLGHAIQASIHNKVSSHDNPQFETLGEYQAVKENTLSPDQEKTVHHQLKEFTGFFDEEKNLDQAVKNAAGKTDPASVRLQEWDHVVRTVSHFKDPVGKLIAINNWVQTFIAPDTDRPAGARPGENWVESSQEALERGLARCGGYAGLVAASAQDAGLPKEDIAIAILSGYMPSSSKSVVGHAVALVRINDVIYISDPTMKIGVIDANSYFEKNSTQNGYFRPNALFRLDGTELVTYGSIYNPGVGQPGIGIIQPQFSHEETRQYLKLLARADELRDLPKIPYKPSSGKQFTPSDSNKLQARFVPR